MSPPQLQTLDGQPMTWEEAHRRAEAWYERERQVTLPRVPAYVPPTLRRAPEAEAIIRRAEQWGDVPTGTIRSKRRDEHAIELRDAVALALRLRGWGRPEIARTLNRQSLESLMVRAHRRHDAAFLGLVDALVEVRP